MSELQATDWRQPGRSCCSFFVRTRIDTEFIQSFWAYKWIKSVASDVETFALEKLLDSELRHWTCHDSAKFEENDNK